MTIQMAKYPVVHVWRSPQAPREIDRPVCMDPPDLAAWLHKMKTEDRKGLGGRLDTQLLLGEPVRVLQEEDGWFQVVVPDQPTHLDERGYPGWVPSTHLIDHPDYSRAWTKGPLVHVTATTSRLCRADGSILFLSYMTRLPRVGEQDGDVWVLTPDGKTGLLPAADVITASQLPVTDPATRIDDAQRFLGLPYLWAGMSSFGFDCSGFMYRLFQAGGIRIPRDAHDQFHSGRPIPAKKLAAGDLVFFAHEQGTGVIHHVGMMVDHTRFIHSPRSGFPVRINRLTEEPYHGECCGGARYEKP
ncbi:C40 family peptidase [Desmospora profundinema]|uniref:Cell wall-associated NlpC family hydrolase n=1 Tax=Desmospora profundinema TaxID=1571184 RepID=A0ABU1IJQ6_9BACL|nr:C40 family peptidase [Desmospora profundinema]MDR6224993.1 cell wall-associated NlpC family hydrolase [Desmospora profundinema]